MQCSFPVVCDSDTLYLHVASQSRDFVSKYIVSIIHHPSNRSLYQHESVLINIMWLFQWPRAKVKEWWKRSWKVPMFVKIPSDWHLMLWGLTSWNKEKTPNWSPPMSIQSGESTYLYIQPWRSITNTLSACRNALYTVCIHLLNFMTNFVWFFGVAGSGLLFLLWKSGDERTKRDHTLFGLYHLEPKGACDLSPQLENVMGRMACPHGDRTRIFCKYF